MIGIAIVSHHSCSLVGKNTGKIHLKYLHTGQVVLVNKSIRCQKKSLKHLNFNVWCKKVMQQLMSMYLGQTICDV